MAHTLPSQLLTGCDDGFFVCMAQWASEVTSGAFWLIAIVALEVVIFMATSRYGSSRAFGFASMSGLLASVWLAIIGLLAWWAASMFILIGVIGFAVMSIRE